MNLFLIFITAATYLILEGSAAKPKCRTRKLTFKSKDFITQVLPYKPEKNPKFALKGCKSELKMIYEKSNIYMIEPMKDFRYFWVKILCFETKYVREVEMEFQVDETFSIGYMQMEGKSEVSLVRMAKVNSWGKTCTKFREPLKWLKLKMDPWPGYENIMLLRNMYMVTCSDR